MVTLPGAAYAKPGSTGLPFFGVVPEVVTTDGRVHTGLLAGEAATSVTLRNAVEPTPKDEKQLPFFDEYADTIQYGPYHGYTLADKKGYEPAFPFGYGLSYTTFAFDNLKVTPSAKVSGSIDVTADVTNIGNRPGDAVVQLYTLRQLPHLFRTDIPLDPDLVFLVNLVARMGQTVCPFAVISQEQQPLGIVIQPSHRVNAFLYVLQQISDNRPPLGILHIAALARLEDEGLLVVERDRRPEVLLLELADGLRIHDVSLGRGVVRRLVLYGRFRDMKSYVSGRRSR